MSYLYLPSDNLTACFTSTLLLLRHPPLFATCSFSPPSTLPSDRLSSITAGRVGYSANNKKFGEIYWFEGRKLSFASRGPQRWALCHVYIEVSLTGNEAANMM